MGKRKFQVCNGYLLEFDQLARVLHFLRENKDAKKISRKELQEDTGLANRQLESLVSIGSAIGLIQPGRQILTKIGLLVAEHDIFLEDKSTLEWCHYVGSGTFRNLIWFEIFNHTLAASASLTQDEMNEALRQKLRGKYTERTIGKHLYEEVRFVLDAYLERNFRKLELLHQSSDERLYRRRYISFNPLIISAMIYDFCKLSGDNLYQVEKFANTPGSPAFVFGLDTSTLCQQIERLHESGWLRYETKHNLDQIRLKPGFSPFEFLAAHFEDREPYEVSNQMPRDIIQ